VQIPLFELIKADATGQETLYTLQVVLKVVWMGNALKRGGQELLLGVANNPAQKRIDF
jgi:hypothetical protein